MRTTSRTLALLMAGALAAGCATEAWRQRPPSAGVASRNTVTAAELSRAGTDDLMSALQAIRPWFLTGRGSAPLVVIDYSPATELSVLRSMRVSEVSEVRYLQASTAGVPGITSDGRTIVGNVLVVRTRHGR